MNEAGAATAPASSFHPSAVYRIDLSHPRAVRLGCSPRLSGPAGNPWSRSRHRRALLANCSAPRSRGLSRSRLGGRRASGRAVRRTRSGSRFAAAAPAPAVRPGRQPAVSQRAFVESGRLAPLVARRPGLRLPGAVDGFELALRAVLGQQVTVAGASTLAGRLARLLGEPLTDGPAALTRLPVTPERLAEASLESIGGIGLPRAGRSASLRWRVSWPWVARPNSRAKSRALIPSSSSESWRPCPALAPGRPRMCHTGPALAGRVSRERHRTAQGHGWYIAARLRLAAETWRPWRAYAAMHLWTRHTHEPTGSGEQLPSAAPARRRHILVLPNAWDAMSARLIEMAGARAIATRARLSLGTGRPDGHGLTRDSMIEAARRIAASGPGSGHGGRRARLWQGYSGERGDGSASDRRRGGWASISKTGWGQAQGIAEVGRPRAIGRRTGSRRCRRRAPVHQRSGRRLLPQDRRGERAIRRHGRSRPGLHCSRRRRHFCTRRERCLHDQPPRRNDPGASQCPSRAGSASIAELRDLGVARASLGPRIAQSVMAHIRHAAREILDQGTYEALRGGMPFPEANGLFKAAETPGTS